MTQPPWYDEIDHTGDAGIRVVADDLSSLFERAAWGMFNVITELDLVVARDNRAVEIYATDRDDLLLRWLSELNFLHITERVLFVRFRIRQLTDTSLKADAWGEPIDRQRHLIHTEVKAVTYHGLVVEQRADGWHAQVIFDM